MKQSRCQLGAWMVLLLVLPAAAQAGTAAAVVRGVVRDPQGAPQMGALVQLLSPDATAIASAVTDMKGRYRMRDVAPGRYQLRATATLFLPALRRNLRLASGAQATVNLTLAALINTGQWAMPRRRNPDDADDDWRWTLRSAENRPVLRVLGDGSVTVAEGGAHRLLDDRRVAASAGTGELGGGGIHTVVLADRGVKADGAAIFRADVGAGGAPTLNVGMGLERGLGYLAHVRTAVVYAEHPELMVGAGAGLNEAALLNAQRMKFGDTVAVEVGSELREVRSTDTGQSVGASQALPFVRVSVEPRAGLMVTYKMATARELQSFDDMDSVRAQLPAAALSNGRMQVEGGRHQELSVTERLGAGTVQAAFYQDHLDSVGIGGVGTPTAEMMAAGGVLVDPVTQTFRILGPGYHARGVSVTLNEPLTRSLWVAAEYDNGDALAGISAGEVHAAWMQSGMVAVVGKWDGGTRLRVAYRWQPGDALTAVNQYDAGSDGAYLSVSLRRPLRCHGVLPDGLEAAVNVQNLLAQGYQPIGISADGGTLFLAQSGRVVQGGLAFTF